MNPKWLLALGLSAPLAFSAPNPAAAPDDVLEFTAGGEGLAIRELIEAATEVTGEPFFYDVKDLEKVAVRFTGTVKVPRAEFLSFFDRCLRDADFVHLESKAAIGTTHTIRRLGQQARGSQQLKAMARFVTPEELATLSGRPATLVTTVYTCRTAPAREMVTTMNLYFADGAVETIRNIEGTNSIVMTGFAQSLGQHVSLMRQIEASMGEDVALASQRELQKRIEKLEADVARLTSKGGP